MNQVNSKEVEKLLALALEIDKNRPSKEDFEDIMRILTDFARETRDLTKEEVENVKKLVDGIISELKDENSQSLLSTKKTVEERLNGAIELFEKSLKEKDKEHVKAINYLYDRVSRIKNGVDGTDGIDGNDGEDGKDGSPDTGKEIVDKINALPIEPEFQIDWKHIKGLENAFSKVERAGGGTSQMGVQFVLSKIIKHATFTISASTTSVALTAKVAGNVCLWVRYNGKMLTYGTDYTVSNAVVTFVPNENFVVEDSTQMDITWISGI